MNCAESLVPASICMAFSSVEGASTLSEVRDVGLYQYNFSVLLPEKDDVSNVPVATSTKTLAEVRSFWWSFRLPEVEAVARALERSGTLDGETFQQVLKSARRTDDRTGRS